MLFEKDGVLYNQGDKVMVEESSTGKFLWPGILMGYGGYSDYYSVRVEDNPTCTEAFSIEQISPYNRRLDPHPSPLWRILFYPPLLLLGGISILLHLKHVDEPVSQRPFSYWFLKAIGCRRVVCVDSDGTERTIRQKIRLKSDGSILYLMGYDIHTKQLHVFRKGHK